MKRTILIFVFFAGVFAQSSLSNAECLAGGEGATSCTYRTKVSIGPFALWSVEGSSVSCGDGYYACCNATTAECVEVPSLADGGN
jgi:hypothetical protein